MQSKHTARKVVIVILTIIILGVILVATYPYWMLRIEALYVRYELRNHDLNSVPVDLILPSNEIIQGQNITLGSISLTAPWAQGINRGDDTDQNFIAYAFQTNEGKSVIIVTKELPLYQTFTDSNPRFISILGTSVSTNYELFKQSMMVTPSDINIFSSNKQVVEEGMMFLPLKVILDPFGAYSVYSFTNQNGIRGFEGNITATSTAAFVFTPKDDEYEVLVGNATASEVDSILQSIKSQ